MCLIDTNHPTTMFQLIEIFKFSSFKQDTPTADNLLHPWTVHTLLAMYFREFKLPLATSERLLRRLSLCDSLGNSNQSLCAVSANRFVATSFAAVAAVELVESLRRVFRAADIELGLGRVECDLLIDAMRSTEWPKRVNARAVAGNEPSRRDIGALIRALLDKQDDAETVSESEFVTIGVEWLDLI
jgi:hypothetical protein